jgi:hypothetical protein
MKKLQIVLGLGAMSALLFMNSCTDSTTNAVPEINSDQDSPVVLGTGVDNIALTGTITSEAKLDEVTVHRTVGGSTVLDTTVTSFDDASNYTYRFVISDITAETTIEIKAVDKDGQDASLQIVIQLTEGSINSYSAILLGAQGNAEPSCLDANTGTRYSVNQTGHDAEIDMIYYYGTTNLATLAAPNDETVNGTGASSLDWTNDWDPQNATLFGSTTLDFNDINYNDLSGISGLSASKINELAVDDVYAFQTADGKKGLVKVTDLTTGAGGTITIHIKIQE